MSEVWLLVVLSSLPGVIVPCVFWMMHAALARRVDRLEAQQHNLMTHADARKIYERLAGLESEVKTLKTTLLTIEKYLREQGR